MGFLSKAEQQNEVCAFVRGARPLPMVRFPYVLFFRAPVSEQIVTLPLVFPTEKIGRTSMILHHTHSEVEHGEMLRNPTP